MSPEKALAGLKGEALRIATTKEFGWQAMLFVQLLDDGIEALSDERFAYDNGIARGPGERVTDEDVPAWVVDCIDHATRLVQDLTRLVNSTVNQELKGKDPQPIRRSAHEVVSSYHEAMEWAAGVRRARVPDDWKPVMREIALFTGDVVEKLAMLPKALAKLVKQATAPPPRSHWKKRREVRFEFEVEMANLAGYEVAMENLRQMRGWV